MIVSDGCSSYGELAEAAYGICEKTPVINLILHLRVPIGLDHDPFIQQYLGDAAQWQSKERPPKLRFSHGEFMHRHGNALDYLVAQLKEKPTGNRACISLLTTADFLDSGDDPIPSFLVLQAGLEPSSPDVLFLSAYYRALEVGTFLPINLAEMALITESISARISTVRELDLTIHAFRAHFIPGFRPLEHSDLDAAEVDAIRRAVQGRDLGLIIAWLNDKNRIESIVDTSGVAKLITELSLVGWAGDELLRCMDRVVSCMTQLQEARRNGSHTDRLRSLHDRVSDMISESVGLLRDLQRGN
jgi:hypothetical protein